MVSGIRLATSQRCSRSCSAANIGNTVNSASATVTKGTSAMVVVKVRPPAVRLSRSSRKRVTSTIAASRHGKRPNALHNARRSMPGIMPPALRRPAAGGPDPQAPRPSPGTPPRSAALFTGLPLTSPPRPPAPSVAATRWLAVSSLVGLIVLCLAWELWLAPLRPGGSWLALKVLPLAVPLAGLLNNRMYTYRWVSLLLWLYFTEGVVRAWSDRLPVSRALAGIEIALSLLLFAACALHVRLRLRGAAAARENPAS